jgi:hypothetical protein
VTQPAAADAPVVVPAHDQQAAASPKPEKALASSSTSPASIGSRALPGFDALAAPLAARAPVATVARSSADDAGGSARHAPAAPPCSAGAGAAGAAPGVGSGGSAAVPVTALGGCVPNALRSYRLSPALWRTAAFVSLQERPG